MVAGTCAGSGAAARGVVFVHSCPHSLAAHVEWCLAGHLGTAGRIRWQPQPVLPGTSRCEMAWQGSPGTASRIASDLRAFPGLRFEVTQEPAWEVEGERYCCTPSLGIHRTAMGAHGDALVGEDRLRSALNRSDVEGGDLAREIRNLLGVAWDEELEPFRYAGDGAEVRLLHRVG